jgi:hypothetical protein
MSWRSSGGTPRDPRLEHLFRYTFNTLLEQPKVSFDDPLGLSDDGDSEAGGGESGVLAMTSSSWLD